MLHQIVKRSSCALGIPVHTERMPYDRLLVCMEAVVVSPIQSINEYSIEPLSLVVVLTCNASISTMMRQIANREIHEITFYGFAAELAR